ncbi:hypothetical protein DZC30_14955 [Comamonas testosteroni]|uniref:Uncharacterized protein n=1 Tax=Comamonas testosteroni TaxID=285 RepID=A0A373FIH5_COMTE|nr:hypothetical protein [Comamonas testosteroni]RGE43295.1 hypothetical protein DZC30_14955 [Comamonas testosteroni]
MTFKPFFIIAMAAVSAAAHAARPMNTDDARIVDAKACQLESWIKHPKGHAEFWAQPACNFTGNLELTMGAALSRMDGSTRASAQMLQGKTLFKTMEPNGWGWGLAAGMARDPRRDAGGGHDMYAYMPTSFSFSDDKFVLHTNVGWLREQGSRSNRLTWGLGSETQLQERTWLIAETYGQNRGKPFFQFGVRHWLVPDRVQIDATYGNRMGEGSERWFSLGLRLLTPAFLP